MELFAKPVLQFRYYTQQDLTIGTWQIDWKETMKFLISFDIFKENAPFITSQLLAILHSFAGDDELDYFKVTYAVLYERRERRNF